jgi:tetratricopeptide (TPR) repeat protein
MPVHTFGPRRTRLAAASLAAALTLVPGAASAQRQPFIDHLITLRSLLFGPYGDEGARVTEQLEHLSIALAAWDDAVRAHEQNVRTPPASTAAAVGAEARSALALRFANRGRYGAALFEIEAALLADPGRAQLRTLRGRLLDALGLRTEAAGAYRRAWELDRSDAVNAYLALSIAVSRDEPASGPTPAATLLEAQRAGQSAAARYGPEPIRDVRLIPDRASKTPVFAPARYAEGFNAIAAGDYPRALTLLRTAAARDPLIVDAASRSEAMSTGIARLRTGRVTEAIASLESAASRYPQSSEAQRILGSAYAAAGHDARALDTLRRAVALAPRDERSRLAIVRVLRDAGRLDEAERALRETLTVLPRSAEARWMLGEILDAAGRGIDAARELESAASAMVIAGRAAIYRRAAEIYDRHQEFEHVVRLLTRRVRVDPNNAAAHRHLGLVLSRLGQSDEAFAELAVADLLGGSDAESLTTIGQIHLDAGRLQDAESAARRALVMQPDRHDARYVLGRTLLRLGRDAEARQELDIFQRLRARAMDEQRRAFEIDKLRAEAARHATAGRRAEAAAVWRRIVEQTPQAPQAHLSLAEALVAIGELDAAATHLEHAATLGAGPAVQLRLAEVYARLGRSAESDRARRGYEQDVKRLLKIADP